jgi:hypothetical protein
VRLQLLFESSLPLRPVRDAAVPLRARQAVLPRRRRRLLLRLDLLLTQRPLAVLACYTNVG